MAGKYKSLGTGRSINIQLADAPTLLTTAVAIPQVFKARALLVIRWVSLVITSSGLPLKTWGVATAIESNDGASASCVCILQPVPANSYSFFAILRPSDERLFLIRRI